MITGILKSETTNDELPFLDLMSTYAIDYWKSISTDVPQSSCLQETISLILIFIIHFFQ